jgi:type IV pilus assembly protein PilA
MRAMDENQPRKHTDSFYYQQAVGPRAEYYLALFEKFEHAGEHWVASWNWPAFFCSSAWFAYRRMNGYSFLNLFLPVPAALLILVVNQPASQWVLVITYLIFSYGVIPKYANAIYHRHLKSRIRRVTTSEDPAKTSALPSPPSAMSTANAFVTAVVTLGIPLLILTAIPQYADYAPRAKVAESLALAGSLKTEIAEFHHNNQRFPAPHEAEKFRVDNPKYAQSIAYDAEKRMIVITMNDPQKGKRVAIHAEAKDGTMSWTCRTIDLPLNYLPSACR